MPIDETVIGGEDVIMNDKIMDLGYKLLYVPDVLVYHYRRPNIKSWWKSMYRYGMGRVILPRHRKGEVSLLHIIAGWSVPIFIVVVSIMVATNPIWLLYLLAFLLLVCLGLYWLAYLSTKSNEVGLYMPIVMVIFIVAWSCGYMHELLFPTEVKKCVS